MDFQLPNRQLPPPSFTDIPIKKQRNPGMAYQPDGLNPDQENAVAGNGIMPQPAPEQDTSKLGYDPSKLNGSQSALAEAMTANPGGGYLSRGLGGAPAPNSQLQGVAQQVRPPAMMRAVPQPNRIAGYPSYRTR